MKQIINLEIRSIIPKIEKQTNKNLEHINISKE